MTEVSRIIALSVSALLVLPPAAVAQRDQFSDALVPFYRSLAGVYGDEGPRLTAHLETLSSALTGWDGALRATEAALRARLKDADTRTALEVHTVLASLYAERGRFGEALREIDEDIRIDPTRAAFHEFKALLFHAAGRRADAADAFRAAWMLDPGNPQRAYRLVAHQSAQTTAADLERALGTLTNAERELIRGTRVQAKSPFLTLNSINDDVGGGPAFAPGAYAHAMSLLLGGQFEQGMTALRAAVASDPLVADPTSRSEPMARGIAELRKGRVTEAIGHMEAAVALAPGSSEAQRILGTAHGITGDVVNSLRHLREAVRLNPRDERSSLALARALDTAGALEEAVEALRKAVGELPDSGALRWVLSLTAGKRQRTDDSDLEFVFIVDRLVLLAGRGDLYGQVARLAQGHFDYDRAVNLMEQRVTLTPNNATAHRALGRAYIEQGSEDAGHAELVIALLLDPGDTETLTSLGRLHLAAGRYGSAVEALEKAVAVQPSNGQALQALGNSLVRAGRIDEGRTRIVESERFLAREVEEQRRRRTAGTLAVQAEHELRERRYDRAIDSWRQLIELEGDSASSHLRLAEAFAGAAQLEQAATHVQTAIAMKAGPEAHRRLAELYGALGRAEESARARQTYIERRLRELREPPSDDTAANK